MKTPDKNKCCTDAKAKMKQLEKIRKNIPLKPITYEFPVVTEPQLLKVAKLHENAKLPTKANFFDAGYDLYALNGAIVSKHCHKLIKTGISMAIPEGYVGLIWPRSGLAYKHGLDVFAGVIDSGYRGDVGVILYNSQYGDYCVEAGDRIAQILFQKVEDFKFLEVSSLDDSERDESGFGSSGK